VKVYTDYELCMLMSKLIFVAGQFATGKYSYVFIVKPLDITTLLKKSMIRATFF